MRALNITQPNRQSSLPSLGILTNVVELTYYEMIYIHHQIKEHAKIELRRNFNHAFDRNAIEVYFNGYKLGYISNKVNGIIAKQMDQGKNVVAKVRGLKKKKHTLLSGLDIVVMMM